LHYVELAIHFWQTTFRFNQDQAVHTVTDMLCHHWCSTVVYEQAFTLRGERKALGLSRRHLSNFRTATWTSDCVEVHGVNVAAIFMIAKLDSNFITHTCADHR